MAKRVLAAILWFYVTWYAWSVIASIVGVSEMAGPILGLVAAALVGIDPGNTLWHSKVVTGDTNLAPSSDDVFGTA